MTGIDLRNQNLSLSKLKRAATSVELNLCQSPDYGRQKLSINGVAVAQAIDCYSSKLYWLHPKLGVFDLREGDNTLEVEALEPNPEAQPGNLFGLDYILLVKQSSSSFFYSR